MNFKWMTNKINNYTTKYNKITINQIQNNINMHKLYVKDNKNVIQNVNINEV